MAEFPIPQTSSGEKGKIIPNGVIPEHHELSTIVYFTNLGEEVELIPPAAMYGMKTPDFMMAGLAWEMKSPAGTSRTTIEHVFRRAAHQSQNIVMDLRRTEIPDRQALKVLQQRLEQSHWVKRIKVITKDGRLLDFDKTKDEGQQAS